MVNNLSLLLEKSEVVVLTQELEDENIENVMKRYPNKIFVDLVRSTNRLSGGNYQGLCW
jgi:translation initiation factor 2 beta subunit (eIF-2beta)/eIF-5